jgi:hypothetical protein
MPNQTTVQLVGVGGSPPYTFSPLSGHSVSGAVSFTISSGLLTVDATAASPRVDTIAVTITDSQGNSANRNVEVLVVDQSIFSILTENASFSPTVLPLTSSLALVESGKVGQVTWSLIPSVTTLPIVSISGNSTLNFTLTQIGEWTVGLRCIDQVNNVVTKVITVSVATAVVAQVVDGQLEVIVQPSTLQAGSHSFTAQIQDSTQPSPNLRTQQFTYLVLPEISDIRIEQDSFDYFWGANDITQVTFPILGDFQGYNLGPTNVPVTSNGLTTTIDTNFDTVSVAGPPTSFRNSELVISLNVEQGTTQIALVSRTFTLVSHNGTTDVGQMTCYTRPYFVGDFVGLNAAKPYYNSPSIFKNASYLARVQSGSSLPDGLSLDQNTALIYGPLQPTTVTQSIIEYYDSSNLVHATITIVWDIQQNVFPLISGLTVAQIGVAYSANITTTSTVPITSVSLYRGRLPNGLTLSISNDGTYVTVSGTPTEAGYFDAWLQTQNANAQTSAVYVRFVSNYIVPLTILTDFLFPMLTGVPYNVQLVGFGGVLPYQWTSPQWNVSAGVDGSGNQLWSDPTFPGLTLNQATGIISGTTTAPTSTSEADTFVLTDSRGATADAVLTVAVDDTLRITTPVLPNVVPGQPYGIQMAALGGTPPYTWLPNPNNLPAGITLSSSGVLSGVTTSSSISLTVTIQVTDSAATVATKAYSLVTGAASGMIIDTSGIGPVIAGGPYQGILLATGTFTAPITWSLGVNSPNPMPAGLKLSSGDVSDSGVTTTVSGVTTVALNNVSVLVQAVDANGQSTEAFMILNSVSSLAITTTSLPAGAKSVAYSYQLQASGFNSPFTWSTTSGAALAAIGLALASDGTLSGTLSTTFQAPPAPLISITVTDTLGATVSTSFGLLIQAALLSITTSAISFTAGRAGSVTLVGAGGFGAYVWSVVGSVALPSGITLNPATGVLSGTSSQIGFNSSVTFQVTDSIGAFVQKAIPVTIVSGLTLTAGPDYINSYSPATDYIGFVSAGNVAAISPAPNGSFQIYATGVVSTSPTQMSASISLSVVKAATPHSDIAYPIGSTPPASSATTATIKIVSITGGVALLEVAGSAFDVPPSSTVGDGGVQVYACNVTVTDSGVTVAATFFFGVYNDGSLTLALSSGSFPTLIVES